MPRKYDKYTHQMPPFHRCHCLLTYFWFWLGARWELPWLWYRLFLVIFSLYAPLAPSLTQFVIELFICYHLLCWGSFATLVAHLCLCVCVCVLSQQIPVPLKFAFVWAIWVGLFCVFFFSVYLAGPSDWARFGSDWKSVAVAQCTKWINRLFECGTQ